jgi:hypothetical protein
MTAWTDFVSQDFFRDPAAEIEKLKAHGPVVARLTIWLPAC